MPLIYRLVHWALAFGVATDLFIFTDGDTPHIYVGYFTLGAVFLRFLLPVKVRREELLGGVAPTLKKGTHFFIWGAVILLAITGWMMGLDRFWGEEWLENIHVILSQGLQALIVLHLLGIFLDAYLKKRKTWKLMITGKI